MLDSFLCTVCMVHRPCMAFGSRWFQTVLSPLIHPLLSLSLPHSPSLSAVSACFVCVAADDREQIDSLESSASCMKYDDRRAVIAKIAVFYGAVY